MKETVLNLLIEKHKKSGGHNGYYLADLIKDAEGTYSQIRPIISEIYKEKLLRTQDGIHGVLIFYNPQKK